MEEYHVKKVEDRSRSRVLGKFHKTSEDRLRKVKSGLSLHKTIQMQGSRLVLNRKISERLFFNK